jgi:hypothetical protein
MIGAVSIAPEAQPEAVFFDPNGPGMGLDVDFNNFDLGNIDAIDIDHVIANIGFDINNTVNYSANYNFEDTLKEGEISLGPHETIQDANTDALTLAEASNPKSNPPAGISTHQGPVHSKEMRAQKRKKTEEVDKGQILPEGTRRNRNMTARARGLDSLA